MIRTQVMLESDLFLDAQPTGSRVICDPAPTDTDEDWIVLAENFNYYNELTRNGWEDCTEAEGELYDTSNFYALRKGEVNLIVTMNYKFFCKFVEATHVAKFLNIKDKIGRIFLFHYIHTGDFIEAKNRTKEYENAAEDIDFQTVGNADNPVVLDDQTFERLFGSTADVLRQATGGQQ